MPIHQPGRRLLHEIPLKFVHDRVAGGGRKAADTGIILVPFIDFLIVLVVFLLTSFSATGELVAQSASIKMPEAVNTDALQYAPIIAVDARVVTFEQNRMADTGTLTQSPKVEPIEALVRDLEMWKRNWTLLNPQRDFKGEVILQADKEIDFRVIKKIMFSAARAGFPNVHFAVNAKSKKS